MSNDTAAQPVYFIAHITVNDVEGYRNYEKGFFPVLKPSGARFVTYDDNVTVLEGEREVGSNDHDRVSVRRGIDDLVGFTRIPRTRQVAPGRSDHTLGECRPLAAAPLTEPSLSATHLSLRR